MSSCKRQWISIAHAAAAPSNLDAAIPVRSAESELQNAKELRNLNEDVKSKVSCETSLKTWKLKMWKRGFRERPASRMERWKRSFRARVPSKSESGRCENETFVWGLPQKVKEVELWKQSFRWDFLYFRYDRWSCENETFVRDRLKELQAEDVKPKMWKRLSCETFLKNWRRKRSFCARFIYCKL